ncbi:MAG: B12-binding domain-containing radical SAM protein [Candidatus Helarchaeota archaeon]
MRILLVNPTTREYMKGLFIQAQAPLGILCLAAVLRENGHNVKLYDHNVQNRALQTYVKFDPELIGFTSFTGPMILDGLRLSKFFRAQLDVPIVWGGVHASLLPIQTLNNPNIDMVVIGEGERTIVDLADSVESTRDLSEVKGLIWKKRNNDSIKIMKNAPRPFIKNLDELPFPAWDLIDPQKYFKTSIGWEKASSALYALQSSRGCPFNCGFCYNIAFNKQMWRPKSAARVIEEISYLNSKFKAKQINFKDDNFIVNQERALNICRGLVQEKIDVRFHVDCRVDLFSRTLAQHLQKGGCNQIYFGVESGSPRILKFIKKGISLSQAYKAVRLTRKSGMISSTSFILGFPTETLDDIALTERFIYQLNPDNLLLKRFIPYPGSPLYTYLLQEKRFIPPSKLEDWAIQWMQLELPTSDITPDLLNHHLKRILKAYYIRKFPQFLYSMVKNAGRNHISLLRLLHWGLKTFHH